MGNKSGELLKSTLWRQCFIELPSILSGSAVSDAPSPSRDNDVAANAYFHISLCNFHFGPDAKSALEVALGRARMLRNIISHGAIIASPSMGTSISETTIHASLHLRSPSDGLAASPGRGEALGEECVLTL